MIKKTYTTTMKGAARAQAMTGYALILLLVGIVVVGVLTIMGDSTQDAYEEVNCGLAGEGEDCSAAQTDQEQEEEQEEEQPPDPCPDMEITTNRFRCRPDDKFRLQVDVANCSSVQMSVPGFSGYSRKNDVRFVKTYPASHAISQAYCQPDGANYSTTSVTATFDHDGSGQFITTATFSVTRP